MEIHFCTQSVWAIAPDLNVASSVFRSLVSFWEAPWQFLVCYVQEITTTTGGVFVMYYHSTVIIATVSYHYCSYSYYRYIHLHRYTHCYCTLTYDSSITFIIFYFKISRNFAFLKNIKSVHLCYFWTHLFCCRQINILSLIFDHQQQVHKPSSCYQTKGPLKYGTISGVGW